MSSIKKAIKKFASFVLLAPPKKVNVSVAQINYGGNLLANKTVVITGGGSGIGLHIAKRCIDEGAKVVIAGRNEEKLKRAIEQLGKGAYYQVFDIAEVSSDDEFLSKCEKILGSRIDYLVSNAGISLHEGSFRNVTVEGFDSQYNTNLKGNYFLCKAFLEYKLEEEDPCGGLLVISSETGDQVYDIPYGMTKASVNSFVRAFSRRVYKSGIRVNAIAPGVTETDMISSYADTSDGNMYRNCASDRVFKPEEIAEVALFLLSDASNCISGEVIHCNAGNHLKPFWE